jgi:hypothetical protein
MSKEQIALPGLWYRCRDFVTEQSAGEWSDKDIADDADRLFSFISDEIARIAPHSARVTDDPITGTAST